VARLGQAPDEAFTIGAAGADIFEDLLGRLDRDLFSGAVGGGWRDVVCHVAQCFLGYRGPYSCPAKDSCPDRLPAR
jgi:hypothetical protein